MLLIDSAMQKSFKYSKIWYKVQINAKKSNITRLCTSILNEYKLNNKLLNKFILKY